MLIQLIYLFPVQDKLLFPQITLLSLTGLVANLTPAHPEILKIDTGTFLLKFITLSFMFAVCNLFKLKVKELLARWYCLGDPIFFKKFIENNK